MKIFVITFNPKEHSSKQEYVDTFIDEAKKCGHEVKVVNVYDLNIEYLKFNKEKSDFDYELSEELKQIQQDILWADHYVFVYPIWYLFIPSKMLDFLSQVFAIVLCELTQEGPKPLFKGKTATIMHSYSMPYFCMRYLYKDVPMKWWKVVLMDWCGVKITKRFDFDLIDSVPEKRKQRWLKRIKNFVKTI